MIALKKTLYYVDYKTLDKSIPITTPFSNQNGDSTKPLTTTPEITKKVIQTSLPVEPVNQGK